MEEMLPTLLDGRAAGYLIGRWKLGRLLEDGQHGPVYEAEEDGAGRRGALQVLTRHLGIHGTNVDRTFNAERRFFDGQRAAAKLGDPRIVQVLDAGLAGPPDTGWIAYLVTELLGPTLASLLQREGGMGLDGALEVAVPVARALASAHAGWLVHRALSPGVIHVGDGVKLGGFGVFNLRVPDEDDDPTDDRIYTPLTGVAYYAPEQILGARLIEASVDVYSLGLVLHECVTGRPVFEVDSLHDLLQKKLFGSDPDLPPAGRRGAELDRLVKRMLSREPNDRPVLKEVIGRLERLRG
jgi:serine/threonine-protein kinase